MLQTQAVDIKLLELLTKVMENPVFSAFNLVGGTSLALQIGHRKSVDIDLFGNYEIDFHQFITTLQTIGKVVVLKQSKNILVTTINGIKVDFVNYKYPLILEIIKFNNLRLISLEDICAMKLNAIAGRGSRKDFIDIYFLLNYFSLSEMIEFYNRKFEDGSQFMVLKSMTYFDDAETEETPFMLKNFDWNICKNTLINAVSKF